MLPPPLLNCASLAKEFRTDSSAVNRALTMDCEEPEPNRRARCSQGSARIIVPFRKQGFRGPLITSHLNQLFYYVAVAPLKCFKKNAGFCLYRGKWNHLRNQPWQFHPRGRWVKRPSQNPEPEASPSKAKCH